MLEQHSVANRNTSATTGSSAGEHLADQGGGSLGASHPQLSDRVAEALRRAIGAGRYQPGERLVEGRLAKDFGVSRIPVREALRVLAAEGVVDVQPRYGASVAVLSREAAREMIEVRAALEGLNARLAARHRDAALLQAVTKVLQRGNAAAAAGRLDQLTRFNAEFHDLLAKAGSNSVLGDLMRTLRERTQMLFPQLSAEQARRTWDEHAAILQAVIAGDADLAELLAERHVTHAGEIFLGRPEGST
jgi:DNA-binding GntR family transcriptional regulator